MILLQNDTLNSSIGSDYDRNTFQKHANEQYNTSNDSLRWPNNGLVSIFNIKQINYLMFVVVIKNHLN